MGLLPFPTADFEKKARRLFARVVRWLTDWASQLMMFFEEVWPWEVQFGQALEVTAAGLE